MNKENSLQAFMNVIKCNKGLEDSDLKLMKIAFEYGYEDGEKEGFQKAIKAFNVYKELKLKYGDE